ncbi:MAG TPA: hypothetical protein VGJ56_10240 [Reyranella sp.]|jgi:hypothetical protein
MSFTKLTLLSTAASAVFIVGAVGPSFAATAWQNSHPRRVEVNHRLGNENHRINQDRRDGELSRGQARQLHRDDHQIRQEERDMAAPDHGHLTRADQRVLNHQENRVNRQTNRDTSHWADAHGRRDEVNDRLENQGRRINAEYREGEISHGQAQQLHRDDRQVAQEERYMAGQDNGHITRGEQGMLNQQENGISHEIGR